MLKPSLKLRAHVDYSNRHDIMYVSRMVSNNLLRNIVYISLLLVYAYCKHREMYNVLNMKLSLVESVFKFVIIF